MASEWKTIRAADFIEFNPRLSITKNAVATKVAMDKLQPFTKKIPATEQAEFAGGSKFCNGDTIMARITPCLENGKTAFVDVLQDGAVGFGSTEFIVMRARDGISDPQFILLSCNQPILPKCRHQVNGGIIRTAARTARSFRRLGTGCSPAGGTAKNWRISCLV